MSSTNSKSDDRKSQTRPKTIKTQKAPMKSNTTTRNTRTTKPSSVTATNSPNRIKNNSKLCRYGMECRNRLSEKGCSFIHQIETIQEEKTMKKKQSQNNGNNQRIDGDTTMTRRCRYKDKCRNPTCKFIHPTSRQLQQSMQKQGNNNQNAIGIKNNTNATIVNNDGNSLPTTKPTNVKSSHDNYRNRSTSTNKPILTNIDPETIVDMFDNPIHVQNHNLGLDQETDVIMNELYSLLNQDNSGKKRNKSRYANENGISFRVGRQSNGLQVMDHSNNNNNPKLSSTQFQELKPNKHAQNNNVTDNLDYSIQTNNDVNPQMLSKNDFSMKEDTSKTEATLGLGAIFSIIEDKLSKSVDHSHDNQNRNKKITHNNNNAIHLHGVQGTVETVAMSSKPQSSDEVRNRQELKANKTRQNQLQLEKAQQKKKEERIRQEKSSKIEKINTKKTRDPQQRPHEKMQQQKEEAHRQETICKMEEAKLDKVRMDHPQLKNSQNEKEKERIEEENQRKIEQTKFKKALEEQLQREKEFQEIEKQRVKQEAERKAKEFADEQASRMNTIKDQKAALMKKLREEKEAARLKKEKEKEKRAQKAQEEKEERAKCWKIDQKNREEFNKIICEFCVAELIRLQKISSQDDLKDNHPEIFRSIENETGLLYNSFFSDSLCDVQVIDSNKKELHGRNGYIMGWYQSKQKYKVALETKKQNMETVFIEPSNLMSIPMKSQYSERFGDGYIKTSVGNIKVSNFDYFELKSAFACGPSSFKKTIKMKLLRRAEEEKKAEILQKKREDEIKLFNKLEKERKEWNRKCREAEQEEYDARRAVRERLREEYKAKMKARRRRYNRHFFDDDDFFPGVFGTFGGFGRRFGNGVSFGIGPNGQPYVRINPGFSSHFFEHGFDDYDDDYDDYDDHDDYEDSNVEVLKEEHAKVLGISSDASVSEIKAAFRKKALKFHPDKYKQESADGMSKEQAEEHFKHCASAYEFFSQLHSEYEE